MNADDPSVPQAGKPAMNFPYATVKYDIVNLAQGASVTVTMVFPGNIYVGAQYYKIDSTNGWHTIPFGDNDGDSTITLTLTDGDPDTDADGQANGIISDPGAIAVPPDVATSDGGGSSGCFIATAAYGSVMAPHVKILRDFRDRFLRHNALGKAFLNIYYTYSPPMADFIAGHDHIRTMVRWSLLPLVGLSWMSMKLGLIPSLALILLFNIGLIGLVRLKLRPTK